MSQKKPRELYKERNQRVNDAIALKEPDRVPITPFFDFYPAKQKGLTKKEAMYNQAMHAQAAIDLVTTQNWDQAPPIISLYSGELLDALGVKFLKWPGAADENQRLKDDDPFQFVEAEYMKAEEYNDFFNDPSGFFIRKVIPRNFSKLKGFEEFPDMVGLGFNLATMFSFPLFFGSPEPQKMFKSMQEGVSALFKAFTISSKYEKDLKKLGFPLQYANLATAPFDVVSDGIRGMRGTMLDMYRNPEELKEMIDRFIQPCIDSSLLLGKMYPHLKVVGIFLHRGADSFMSNKQFEEFYWPSLSKVMDELIKNDFIPMPFYEGGYNDRLEYLTDFAKNHKGKLIYWFDKTDIFKAKELLGDYACIRGNVPGSLLTTGTPQKVEEYVKNSIEKCAEGGGFLLDGGVAGIPTESKPENVQAMTETVFKYGVYRK